MKVGWLPLLANSSHHPLLPPPRGPSGPTLPKLIDTMGTRPRLTCRMWSSQAGTGHGRPGRAPGQKQTCCDTPSTARLRRGRPPTSGHPHSASSMTSKQTTSLHCLLGRARLERAQHQGRLRRGLTSTLPLIV
jgi:hypothetical protein